MSVSETCLEDMFHHRICVCVRIYCDILHYIINPYATGSTLGCDWTFVPAKNISPVSKRLINRKQYPWIFNVDAFEENFGSYNISRSNYVFTPKWLLFWRRMTHHRVIGNVCLLVYQIISISRQPRGNDSLVLLIVIAYRVLSPFLHGKHCFRK